MADAEQMSLDGILSGEERKKPEPAKEAPKDGQSPKDPVEKQQAERNTSARQRHRDIEQDAQGRVRDPVTGQYAPKVEKEAQPAAPAAAAPAAKEAAPAAATPAAAPAHEELTSKERAAFAKAADETRKRQALEQRIRELEAQKQPPAEPAKTFWDDPEAAFKQQEARVQQAVLGTRIQTSESIARSRHQDFDEKVLLFRDLAMSTPGLADQAMVSPDPAEFVYRTAANHKALQDAGGLDEMKKKIEAETTVKVRAELEKELKDKAELLAKERAALPGSLSDAPAKGGNSRPVWGGPKTLDDILSGQ